MFAQRRNLLTTHLSEQIPVVKRSMTLMVQVAPFAARILAGTADISLLQIVVAITETHPVFYIIAWGSLPRSKWLGRGLTTYIHLMPELGTSGVTPPLLEYASMPWVGTNFNLLYMNPA
jgi:hypothetical protein